MIQLTRIYLTALIILLTSALQAQEVITPLTVNRQLTGRATAATLTGNATAATAATLTKSAQADDPLPLPFSDDFSYPGPYPSPERWADRQVFINNTFSVRQPSMGVATFDCLDESGMLYERASHMVFEADRLTSLPLALDYPPSDSIILSFCYEAGGTGDMPETNDSLTLAFWAPEEERWYSMWQARGGETNGFVTVMIPITNPVFLKEGFRFRFTGYASLAAANSEPSLAANSDQWNIDHVLLDRGRSIHDTVLHDVALTLPVRSLVKEYEAMPWRHFRQAYLSAMRPTVTISYRNNDTIVRNVTRHVTITDLSDNSVVRDLDAGAANASPLSDNSHDAPLLYTFDSSAGADSAKFLVTVSLITDEFDPKQNNTMHYVQRFADYFAIDDGSAEAGYGINGQGSRNAMAALRFRSFIPDSVAAITICFNDAYNRANQRSFDLMVWGDDNGRPGALLGSSEGPVASPGEEINGFVTYLFDEPVSVDGHFWVGWQQNSETFLNVGLDLNTAHDGRHYYHISGQWQESMAPGTIMVRPVMKQRGTTTSVPPPGTLTNQLFSIYPNPFRERVTLVPSDDAPDEYTIEVISNNGVRVISMSRTEHPDLSRLAPGTYYLMIRSGSGRPLSLLRIVKIN